MLTRMAGRMPLTLMSLGSRHLPRAGSRIVHPHQCHILTYATSPVPTTTRLQPLSPTGVMAGLGTAPSMTTAGVEDHKSAFVVVYVTVPNQEIADQLSSSLVEAQLAACVNILPGVTSVYRWEGQVSRDQELLLIIKTRRALVDLLASHVSAHHPYDVPEVISLPILGGSVAYLQWLADSTQHAGRNQ